MKILEKKPVSNVSSPNTRPYGVLVVDDDSTIRDNLKEYLSFYHQADYELEIDEASTAEDAFQMLESKEYDLIISDINLPDQDGFAILREAVHHNPDIKRALITAYDLDTYITMAKEEKVYNIIVKTAPFNFSEFSVVVDNLLNPKKAFGLDKYIDEPAEPITEIVVKSSHEIMQAQQELKDFFQRFGLPDIDALAIVIVEAITNAVYHSAKLPDGSLRYQKGEIIDELKPEEQVIISYGFDDEKLGLSIRDQGGSMSADEILYWLERNITGQSLMDTHGRGIYLIHRLMDRVIINLSRNNCTEIILLHYLQEMSGENKPLYINQL